MNPTDEFELPLTIQRTRCANTETMEWRLKLGNEVLLRLWRNKSAAPETVVRDLLARHTTSAATEERYVDCFP